MHKSIQWRVVIIYFLLVWLAMSIVGVYITEAEKKHQLGNMTTLLTQKADLLVGVLKEKMGDGSQDIETEVHNWYVNQSDQIKSVVVFDRYKVPKVSRGDWERYPINDTYLDNALQGKSHIDGQSDGEDEKDYKKNYKVAVKPVISTNGDVLGAVYIIADMSQVNASLDNIKSILSTATLLALVITAVLGSLLAKTITEPIKALTEKAENLAMGDFGQTIPVLSNDEIGQLTEMFNYMSGRTKETLEAMDGEKRKVETILMHMTDGVVAVTVTGMLMHVNPAALRFFALTKKETEAMDFDQMADRIALGLHKEDLFRGDDEKMNNTLFLCNQRILRLNIDVYSNDANQLSGAIMVIQDVTDQEKLDQMRKEFVANVSHELRTPLTTIKSYTETLLDGAVEDATLSRNFLSVIDSESERMTRLVKDLLQLSKMDYDKTQWKMQKINPKEVVASCVENMRINAIQKEQTLTLEFRREIPEFMVGDKDRIAQVLINIISNAVKYTGEGGQIKVILSSEDDYVVIQVVDNGIGIPKEDLPRIFERFYRVDKARSRAMGGTGLGLSIAKQIIDAHQGDIYVNSEYGQGTMITIKLKQNIVPTERI